MPPASSFHDIKVKLLIRLKLQADRVFVSVGNLIDIFINIVGGGVIFAISFLRN